LIIFGSGMYMHFAKRLLIARQVMRSHNIRIGKPVPSDDEVLVKVRVASLTSLDWHFLTGRPYIARIMAGLLKPKYPVLGIDVAEQVEAVGANFKQFQPGDEVFGLSFVSGAFAEYLCLAEAQMQLVDKPPGVSFENAAAVPFAGYTALTCLRDLGQIQAWPKVLINGASGGVGTLAVQIAKAFGAEVTGVCSTRNLEMVRSIGADQVIDRCYPLSEVPEALRYLGKGHARGKVVITV
jgi:NADPH:quinone reductase-like Zn-dependent oxidoreductase